MFGIQPLDEKMGHAESPQVQVQDQPPPAEETPNLLVLELVTPFLADKDLCNARTTCTGWKNIFTPVLRARRTVPLKLSNYQTEVNNWGPGQASSTSFYSDMTEFVELMSKSTEVPFDNYDLGLDFTQTPAVIQNFFTTSIIGQSVHALKISLPFWTAVNTNAIREAIFSSTPNLVDLELHFKRGRDPATTESESELWRFIPNLKRLKFYTESSRLEYAKLLTDLIRGASNLEQLSISSGFNSTALAAVNDYGGGPDGCLATLKILHLDELSATDLQRLIELCDRQPALELQEFKTKIVAVLDPSPFSQFLALQAQTLAKLDIFHKCVNYGFPLRLPFLPKLSAFKYITPSDGQIAASENENHTRNPFLELEKPTLILNFPNLAKLECGSSLCAGHGTISILEWAQVVDLPNEIERIALLFPNLELLKITFKNVELLPKIWTLWPRMRVLRVSVTARDRDPHDDNRERQPQPRQPGSRVIYVDELITGIPKSKFRPLFPAIRDGTIGQVQSQLNLAQLKTAPGITDMKQLREFTLIELDAVPADHGAPRWFVTKISEYFGFKAHGSKVQKHLVQRKNVDLSEGSCVPV